MTKRIGCFHAHHTNIDHIQKALGHYDVELVHFVDPGLDRIKSDPHFTSELAQRKIQETLNWIASCHVDAILITCTFFTANMTDDHVSHGIPIIKIDDPLFQSICADSRPQMIVFTNPSTVAGTMHQLRAFANQRHQQIQVESVLLEDTFELIMQGKQEEYLHAVSNSLTQLAAKHPDTPIIAAQLSMVPAAKQVASKTGTPIGNHLTSLSAYLQRLLVLNN